MISKILVHDATITFSFVSTESLSDEITTKFHFEMIQLHVEMIKLHGEIMKLHGGIMKLHREIMKLHGGILRLTESCSLD